MLRTDYYRDDKGHLYYEYQTSSDEAKTTKVGTVRLKLTDVLHVPGLGFDGLVAYSPIAMAKNAIGMAIACEEYGAKFFANGRLLVVSWESRCGQRPGACSRKLEKA